MDDEHGWNAVGTRLDAVGTRLDSLWVLFLPFNFRGPLLGLGGLPSILSGFIYAEVLAN